MSGLYANCNPIFSLNLLKYFSYGNNDKHTCKTNP